MTPAGQATRPSGVEIFPRRAELPLDPPCGPPRAMSAEVKGSGCSAANDDALGRADVGNLHRADIQAIADQRRQPVSRRVTDDDRSASACRAVETSTRVGNLRSPRLQQDLVRQVTKIGRDKLPFTVCCGYRIQQVRNHYELAFDRRGTRRARPIRNVLAEPATIPALLTSPRLW